MWRSILPRSCISQSQRTYSSVGIEFGVVFGHLFQIGVIRVAFYTGDLLIVFFCGFVAMRVAAESRRSFREALEVSGLKCTFGDAALDSVIRHVRQTISLKKPNGLDEEQEALSLALVEIRCLVENFARQEGWDESAWQLFLWNAFCASWNPVRWSGAFSQWVWRSVDRFSGPCVSSRC